MNNMLSPYAYVGIRYKPRLIIDREDIVNIVLIHYGLSFQQLTAGTRKRGIVEARQIVMLLLRTHTALTLEDVGGLLSLDHTTVLSGVKYIRGRLDTEEPLRVRYQKLKEDIMQAGKLEPGIDDSPFIKTKA